MQEFSDINIYISSIYPPKKKSHKIFLLYEIIFIFAGIMH